MAKRHHSGRSMSDESKHDHSFEMSEPKGKRAYGMYEGESHRRHQEMEDAGMIHEDHSAVSNLPQNVIMKMYPRSEGYMPEVLDDTINGIDRQKGMDAAKERSELRPKKY